MWKKLLRHFGILLLTGTYGCALMSTPEKIQVTEYDLGTVKSAPASAKLGVEFGAFRNLSGAGTPMLFREKDGSLWFTLHSPNDKYLERPVFFPVETEGGLRLK